MSLKGTEGTVVYRRWTKRNFEGEFNGFHRIPSFYPRFFDFFLGGDDPSCATPKPRYYVCQLKRGLDLKLKDLEFDFTSRFLDEVSRALRIESNRSVLRNVANIFLDFTPMGNNLPSRFIDIRNFVSMNGVFLSSLVIKNVFVVIEDEGMRRKLNAMFFGKERGRFDILAMPNPPRESRDGFFEIDIAVTKGNAMKEGEEEALRQTSVTKIERQKNRLPRWRENEEEDDLFEDPYADLESQFPDD